MIYNVLNKRLACNMEEDVNEMINIFMIKSNIPLSESIGFDADIRSATQSKVDYSLSFDKW